MLGPTPRDSDLIGLDRCEASGFFKVLQVIVIWSQGGEPLDKIDACVRWSLPVLLGNLSHNKLDHAAYLFCLSDVFVMASKQTHVLVPAGWAPSFLTVLHFQILLLCAAFTWAPRRPFSSITVSPWQRYNMVDCPCSPLEFTHISYCYLITLQFHPFQGQSSNCSRGWRADPLVKRAAPDQLPLSFATQDKLGLSDLFSFLKKIQETEYLYEILWF